MSPHGSEVIGLGAVGSERAEGESRGRAVSTGRTPVGGVAPRGRSVRLKRRAAPGGVGLVR